MIVLRPVSCLIEQLNKQNKFIDGFVAPTIDEFLTEDFFEADFLDKIYPRVKELIESMVDKPECLDYGNYPAAGYKTYVGYGKTVANVLIILYWVLIYSHLKNPAKLLNVSPSSKLTLIWAGSSDLTSLVKEYLQSVISETKFLKKDGKSENYYSEFNDGFHFNNLDLRFVYNAKDLLGLHVVGGICNYQELFYQHEIDDCEKFLMYTIHRILARSRNLIPLNKLVIDFSDSFQSGIAKNIPISFYKIRGLD